MAIYRFEFKVISRSQGRSAVASAAYRSGTSLYDERIGQLHDFSKKAHDIIDSEILLPEKALAHSSLEWMQDREKLWNAVEAVERRKDAQLAREALITLPKELTHEQNWELVRGFVQKEFVDRGMIADVNFHRGHKGQEEQPHAHVMLTLRDIDSSFSSSNSPSDPSSTSSVSHSARLDSMGFGAKNRGWNDRSFLQEIRVRWAEHANLALARNGFDIRIDHRSLADQGIKLEPQVKIGPKLAGSRLGKMEEHQEIVCSNGERILLDPSIALAALSSQQSSFTHHDVAKFVNRNSVDAVQFQLVYDKVLSHPDLIRLGLDDLGRDRFTTRELYDLERRMIESVSSMSQEKSLSPWKALLDLGQAVGLKEKTHGVSEGHIREALKSRALTPDQLSSFDHIIRGQELACVVGFAGTGKSYMLGAAREAWEKEGYRVVGLTLSGIAAEGLESGSGIKSSTIASKFAYWNLDRNRLTDRDIVVVDEAGMVGSHSMARIIEESRAAGAKVVLVGDHEQLQAIDAGASFRAIVHSVGYSEMCDIRRQKEDWQKQATVDFATRKTKEALMAYDRHDNVHSFQTKEMAISSMAEDWYEIHKTHPNKSQIMLSYTRADVLRLNEEARGLMISNGELGESREFSVNRGVRAFAEQDRIYFLKNDKELGVKNGSLGTILSVDDRRDSNQGVLFRVLLDGSDGQRPFGYQEGYKHSKDQNKAVTKSEIHEELGLQDQSKMQGQWSDRVKNSLPAKEGHQGRIVEFNLLDYNEIDYGYAATIHKSQGVTVDMASVLASRHMDCHATYVAMSRHREVANFYYAEEEFPSLERVMNTLSQERVKDFSLDYVSEKDFGTKRFYKDEIELSVVEKEKALVREKEFGFQRQGTNDTDLGHKMKNSSKELDENLENTLKLYLENKPESKSETKITKNQEVLPEKIEKDYEVSYDLTEERMKQAEKRLDERLQKKMIEQDLGAIEKDHGFKVDRKVMIEGEKGVFIKKVVVNEKKYGLIGFYRENSREEDSGAVGGDGRGKGGVGSLEIEKNSFMKGKLVPEDRLESDLKQGDSVEMKHFDIWGKQFMKLVVDQERERELGRNRGRDKGYEYEMER